MTGPEHYAEAERLLDLAHEHQAGSNNGPAQICRTEAAVHATLALAAATALNDARVGLGVKDYDAWRAAASEDRPATEATS